MLVLYATVAVGGIAGRFETIDESNARAETAGARATARRIAATWFLQNDRAERFQICAAVAEQAGLPAILAGLDAMQAWSGQAALSALDAETLILWGDRDRTYSWDQTSLLWSGIPVAHLAVVPACAHAVHMEKPALFSQIVLDFLRPSGVSR